ncbi:hypothetical protein PMIN01_01082 [Paraphaeosphaeria minitans]|uniref:NADH dehydrogenase [ubiquinone] 1 alpha subcomplex subunit 1 n=1 Tax=Paraphaeosphaeria minitans TaxID=565426 RepID=A0A9P6GU24_9PLEO|nr:hypothetical protein PMIN01_01082 [Paraphaeosphaeria minitans]
MGVPFEALLPYGIMLGMFAFSAVSVGKLKEMQNGGKSARRGMDAWDRVSRHSFWPPGTLADAVLERDRRLTGFARGQTDKAEAPPGFELNNPWRVRTAGAAEFAVLTAARWSNDTSKQCTHAHTLFDSQCTFPTSHSSSQRPLPCEVTAHARNQDSTSKNTHILEPADMTLKRFDLRISDLRF